MYPSSSLDMDDSVETFGPPLTHMNALALKSAHLDFGSDNFVDIDAVYVIGRIVVAAVGRG